MNYLAHLTLSFRDPEIMVGNFIADDIPRREEKSLPKKVLEGVQLHRKIDNITDNHPSFKRAVRRLRPFHRKYAPVVLDIINDHLLSNLWTMFYDEPEQDFHRYVYQVFEEQVEELPPRASLHVQTLLKYEYLNAYGNKKGLEGVLIRMDRRTRFPSNFNLGVQHLYDDLHYFQECFIELYSSILESIHRDVKP